MSLHPSPILFSAWTMRKMKLLLILIYISLFTTKSGIQKVLIDAEIIKILTKQWWQHPFKQCSKSMAGQTNINSCRVSEYLCISLNKIYVNLLQNLIQ